MIPLGEYHLSGVHEVGCGIILQENFNFEFYFVYGALDRHAYGIWKKISESEIELNTNYADLIPFTISKEEKRNHKGIQTNFPNYNNILLNETKVNLISENRNEEQVPDTNSNCNFNSTSVERFVITCMFYFDNPAVVIPKNVAHNYFEFLPNHHLPLVHFNQARFKIKEKALVGKLHLLDLSKEFEFIQ